MVTWVLIALTGIDIDHQLLPDDLTLPLLWAGLLAAVFVGPLPGASLPVSPRDALIGAAAGYLSLWSVYHVFRLVTGKEGMGYGDFKLLRGARRLARLADAAARSSCWRPRRARCWACDDRCGAGIAPRPCPSDLIWRPQGGSR